MNVPRALLSGFRIDLHSPEISAPSPGVLAVLPDHVVGEGVGLVAQKLRIRVLTSWQDR